MMPSNSEAEAEVADSSDHGTPDKNREEDDTTFSIIKSRIKRKKKWWNVFKKWKEGEESDWWFASTGIPLLAATLGPLANVSSIAALVTSWRQRNYIDGQFVSEFDGKPYADPRWCYWLNVASLICGFLGNFFLLLNFTQRIRYIIALPATIIFWYISSALLIAITACMDIYVPPHHPYESYTQGFWYAIAAASFYTLCSMILMVNMLGYFLGHYPQNFNLSDSQRTLILQTMAFFIWLAGGAAVFTKIETDAGEGGDWSFSDSLYFCDVTILTVGFGDLVPTTDVGRGLVFPFSVGGIITLALIVSSLYKAVREIGQDKVIRKHIDRMRVKVAERTVTNSFDLRRGEHSSHLPRRHAGSEHMKISAPSDPRPFYKTAIGTSIRHTTSIRGNLMPAVLRNTNQSKLILLKEEKDRFDAMRQIQADTKRFKRWFALFWSITTFAILWCVGAVVFWQAESDAQGMTYFQALYFCYISLLTIGYGDFAPKSNAGRCFFVIWSLIAVPTMTILVSDLGDTVVAKFKKWSDQLADFTVLPKHGIWRAFLNRHPWLLYWLQRHLEARAAKKRLREGFDTMDPRANPPASQSGPSNDPEDPDPDLELVQNPTIDNLAVEAENDAKTLPTQASLSRRLALSIQKVSTDLRLDKPKRYGYEEWVEFTRLIRLTTLERLNKDLGQTTSNTSEEEGLVNWDWIGDDSPMMSGLTESEWLMERLCESLVRLERRKEVAVDIGKVEAIWGMEGRQRRDMPGRQERVEEGNEKEESGEGAGRPRQGENG